MNSLDGFGLTGFRPARGGGPTSSDCGAKCGSHVRCADVSGGFRVFLFPEFVETPGGYGAGVLDGSVEEHLLEIGYGGGSEDEVVFFGVGVGSGGGQAGGEEDVLLLAGEAVGDPEKSQVGHGLGDEASFFAQFAACELFGDDVRAFPASLGQLEGALLNGVAELLDEVDGVSLNGDDDGAVVLVDDSVDAFRTVVPLDGVFAQAEPGVAVDFAGAQGPDAHGFCYFPTAWIGRWRRSRFARRRECTGMGYSGADFGA